MSTELPDKLLELDGEDPGDRDPEPEDEQAESEEKERFVVFRVGSSRYALDVDNVLSVVEVEEYTRLPRSSDAIEGLIDLRGSITAVIDPRVYLDVDGATATDDDPRVVVLDRQGDRQGAGLEVDEVLGVRSVPVSNIYSSPTPEADVDTTSLSHALVDAVIGETAEQEAVSVLDVEGLIRATEHRAATN